MKSSNNNITNTSHFPKNKTPHIKNKQTLPGVNPVSTNLDAVNELDLRQVHQNTKTPPISQKQGTLPLK
jgi:hypothetical protein